MDTIGTIRPEEAFCSPESQLEEAVERLKYLVSRKSAGLLVGSSAVQLQTVTQHLLRSLSEEGQTAQQIHLAGVSADEFPELIATELGVRPVRSSRKIDQWSAISNFASSSKLLPVRRCLILSGLELVDESLIPAIDRILTLIRGTVPVIFTSWQSLREPLRTVLAQHAWMKVEIGNLSPQESVQELAGELARKNVDVKLSSDAAAVAHQLTNGDLNRLRRLAELAAIAAEADELPIIDANVLRSLSEEIPPVA
ncbi:hypothetical protein AB1L42_09515 [Thalassoglobus sp. JC818]|uniref:hypothetical protein n=1 Tax=Thalassoglobus sp. JC818 TaxID=3232136 RepID=UPI00345783EB